MAFELPKLNYAYDALEPHIDAKTMEIHHSKHHNGYATKLNNAVKDSALANLPIEELVKNLDLDNKAVRNNGGGHFNHSLFWSVMAPNAGGNPQGELAQAIDKAFGSFEEFKTQFSNSAATQFGSGWAWLCCSKDGQLSVCSTPNQDNPLMPNGCGNQPILGLDVWEHAYYLNYQNRRPDYIKAFFNVVNWEAVSKNYSEAIK